MAMQQVSPTTYGEMDLVEINGKSYNQSDFRAQVQVAFSTPGDTTTWAAILVQTPAAAGVPGGYIFTLSPDGHWELQYVASDKTIPIEAQGLVTIDPHAPAIMTVIVLNDELYASIDGTEVTSHIDDLGAIPNDIGLIVERQNAAPSSLVQFSDLELDQSG